MADPTITGTKSSSTTSEAPVTPFSGVTVTDPNSSATDTLGIDVQGYGTLSGDGLNNPIGGYYTLTGTAADITKNLDALTYTPTAGPPDTSFTAMLVLNLGNVTDYNTRVSNFDPPVPPTITGTRSGQTTAAEASVTPFAGVTITDPNRQIASAQYTTISGPFNLYNDRLTIALGGAGGALSGDGLTGNNDGTYTLAGNAYTLTTELDALRFTPAGIGTPGSQATTTFTITDTSGGGGLSANDNTTSVTDTLAADAVTVDPTVTAEGYGAFTITGRASSTAGVDHVEVSALVNGQTRDLGAATLNPDGTFSFTDHVGRVPQSLTFTETNGRGGTASAGAPFNLVAGIRHSPYVAQQDSYDPDTGTFTGQTFFNRDGSAVYRDTYTANGDGTSSYAYSDGTFFNGKRYSSFTELYGSDGTLLTETRERNDGSRAVIVDAPAQSVESGSYDTFRNQNQPDTNFVFSPGFGYDQVHGFMAAGGGHDILDLPASDFTNIADVLRHTQDTGGGAVIHDPTSGDAILVAGVSKDELVHNRQDFSFHA